MIKEGVGEGLGRWVWGVLWALVWSLALTGEARASGKALELALDKKLPGKGVEGACDPFARALYQNLTKAGGEAHYIVYRWKSSEGDWSAHAIVVFLDEKGQYLGTDQMRGMPLLLAGKTPEEWVRWYNGPGEVELMTTFTQKKLQGRTAGEKVPEKAEKVKTRKGAK